MAAIVSIENFSYAYPATDPEQKPEWVLRDLSLVVEEGEFVAIMGPTGVGKTTLCLALNGIVPHLTGGVMRGDIRVDGLNTKQQRVADLARSVGVVFQDPEGQLFQSSVEAEVAFGLENLGVPPREIRSRVDWALSQVDMGAHALTPPAQLSGGQKQRAAIASILAMRPKVLVLDEPTANLDPQGKMEVFAVVEGLRRSYGATILLVSYESEFCAEFADRVVVLNEGGLALDGSPETIFSQVEALREIGLSSPQVSELADCLNARCGRNFSFYQLEQAYGAIRSALGAGA